MANQYSIPADLTTVLANIAIVDTVVDAIRAVDVPAIVADVATVDTVVDNIRAVDVPAIDAAITAAALTEKEKVFMGKAGQPTLNEYFQTEAESADPDAAVWTVTEDNDGDAYVDVTDGKGFCLVQAGTVNGNDTVIQTKDKITWAMGKDGVGTLNMRTRIQVNNIAGLYGFGFIREDSLATADLFNTNIHKAGIHIDNSLVRFYTSTNAASENTVISAYVSNYTWAEFLIVITPGVDVKLYIDGTLRATHAATIPLWTLQTAFATQNKNAVNSGLYSQFCEVWAEI